MKSFHNKSFESFFISIFHDASRLQNFTMNLMKKDSFVSSKMIFSLMLTARKVSFNFISEAMMSFADRARTIINFKSMFDSIDFLLLVSLAAVSVANSVSQQWHRLSAWHIFPDRTFVFSAVGEKLLKTHFLLCQLLRRLRRRRQLSHERARRRRREERRKSYSIFRKFINSFINYDCN